MFIKYIFMIDHLFHKKPSYLIQESGNDSLVFSIIIQYLIYHLEYKHNIILNLFSEVKNMNVVIHLHIN